MTRVNENGKSITSGTNVIFKLGLITTLILAGMAGAWTILNNGIKVNEKDIQANVKMISEIQQDIRTMFFQQQRSIDAALLELKHTRTMVEEHREADEVQDAADVREVMRGS